MAAGQGGAPASAGTQDARVNRIEEGQAGLETQALPTGNKFYDANWPNYALTLASHTFGTTTAALTFTATPQYGGLIGNSISVALINPGGTTAALSVSVSGYAITVNLAVTASSLSSTADQVAAAIMANAKANSLVSVVSGSGSGGAGTVVAAAATKLSGGTAATTNTFDAGLAAGVEPAKVVGQVDTQWEAGGVDPWDALKAADPTKW